MSDVERDTATPGAYVSGRLCGYTPEPPDATVCGKPIAYEIRFTGWPSHILAGACEEHAPNARDLDVERIWSVTK